MCVFMLLVVADSNHETFKTTSTRQHILASLSCFCWESNETMMMIRVWLYQTTTQQHMRSTAKSVESSFFGSSRVRCMDSFLPRDELCKKNWNAASLLFSHLLAVSTQIFSTFFLFWIETRSKSVLNCFGIDAERCKWVKTDTHKEGNPVDVKFKHVCPFEEKILKKNWNFKKVLVGWPVKGGREIVEVRSSWDMFQGWGIFW